MEETITGLGVLIMITLIVFILARYNFLIKKMRMERGDNSAFARNSYSFMDIGCIVLSFGIGLGISSIFTTLEIREDTMYLLIYATIFTCGGIGLMVAHYIRKKVGKG
ncbi:hypothetical protein L0P88_11660 [Muricauda sp. SCSIO 64092]|uniref:hypothetical protein n=1 Tax=Allomuricauda sp. SCSIO 64092 TaxID=2908842 RepID=UPI00131B3195|nr:hypothetical protein [Muricauda sp. SCSIO 64092]UOY09167.1 hypothetical protein L0P88_11660 [Muricauda sp. SCSIO 64092]